MNLVCHIRRARSIILVNSRNHSYKITKQGKQRILIFLLILILHTTFIINTTILILSSSFSPSWLFSAHLTIIMLLMIIIITWIIFKRDKYQQHHRCLNSSSPSLPSWPSPSPSVQLGMLIRWRPVPLQPMVVSTGTYITDLLLAASHSKQARVFPCEGRFYKSRHQQKQQKNTLQSLWTSVAILFLNPLRSDLQGCAKANAANGLSADQPLPDISKDEGKLPSSHWLWKKWKVWKQLRRG